MAEDGPAAGHEHFGRLARRLTPPRRTILTLLRETGSLGRAEIEAGWRDGAPDLSPLVGRRLDRIVADSLWRLESVGLVQSVPEGRFAITPAGRDALRELPT